MLEETEIALRGIEVDIARFENPNSLRPHDITGIGSLERLLSGVKEQYESASWTSYKVEQKIKALESRLTKLRQEGVQ